MHIRRIDYDSHVPMFRIFDDPFPDKETLKVTGLSTLDDVRSTSVSLILQHGLAANPSNSAFIILDKHV